MPQRPLGRKSAGRRAGHRPVPLGLPPASTSKEIYSYFQEPRSLERPTGPLLLPTQKYDSLCLSSSGGRHLHIKERTAVGGQGLPPNVVCPALLANMEPAYPNPKPWPRLPQNSVSSSSEGGDPEPPKVDSAAPVNAEGGGPRSDGCRGMSPERNYLQRASAATGASSGVDTFCDLRKTPSTRQSSPPYRHATSHPLNEK